MLRSTSTWIVGLLVILPIVGKGQSVSGSEQERPLVEEYLISGKLAAGEKTLQAHLAKNPADDQARFGLGTLQFVRSIETLCQSLHRHGMRPMDGIPFWRLPIPKNPDPQPISNEAFRKIFRQMESDLQRAEATLSQVKADDVQLPLRFCLIQLDLNGDGKIAATESLWQIYNNINNGPRLSAEEIQQAEVCFDRADVDWLRGYCHVLMALNDMILAHDWQELIERAGHVVFAKVDGPYGYLQDAPTMWAVSDNVDIVDVIAMIHLINLPVIEPDRMEASLEHMEQVIALSRTTWQAIQAETDNHLEWLPGPRQTGVMPGAHVTAEMVTAWHEFLDEAEAILAGEKLVPHWRIRNGQGINLRRVFTEPTSFDLVMWLQGTAARPYVESGDITDEDLWRRLNRVFGQQFIGFAIWFN